ncbi:LysE family transporter [Patescibacteria group bacterium]|nr:LysE family transporter [Patescibacteria group bacterium]
MIDHMYLPIFLKGLVIGFIVAAPVGPIGALCIRRTLQRGKKSGLMTGLGAALADSLYGCIAAFGVTTVSFFLTEHRFWFRLIGSLFLVYLGIRTFRSTISLQKLPSRLEDLVGDVASSFVLMLANPIAILVFGAIFTEFGLDNLRLNEQSGVLMVIGIFLGSMVWWLTLCTIVERLQAHITPRTLRIVNIIAGSVIIAFAAGGFFRVIQMLAH